MIDTISEKTPTLKDFKGDLSKRWYIDFYEGSERKRTWIKSKPLATIAERAKRELQKVISKQKPKNYKLSEVLSKMNLRKKSIQTYQSDINLLESLFPDLIGIDAEAFKSYCIDKYHSNTVRNKIKNLKAVFAFGLECGILPDNPFSKLKSLPPVESDFHFPFTEYERSKIEPELLKNQGLFLFTRFIYYSFTRVKELQNLKVKDIDLRTRTIKIYAENSKTKKAIVKPIVSPLLDLILEYRLLQNPSNFFVFGYNLSPSFEPCQQNLPTNQFNALLKDLDLYRAKETTLYGWKHTGNVNAYLAGMDIRLIQQLNGHSHLETTEIYLRKLGLFLDKRAFDVIF
jgi:integrase